MLMTACGERTSKPMVVHTQDRLSEKTSKTPFPAATPGAPPGGRNPMATPRMTTRLAAAAGLDDAPLAESLIGLLDAGWAASARYPLLWHLPAVSAEEDLERHGPVIDWLRDLIRRGQESGDFDASLSPDWLLAAGLAIGRAAEDEVKAGRMSIDDARNAVHHSFLRLFGLSGL